MSASKLFPTDVAVSAMTGVLITEDFSKVHECYTYAAGEPVWTHQLPRVGRELQAAMVKRPELASLPAESESVNPTNWREWRDDLVKRLGPEIAVPLLKSDEHERIDPLSEAAETVHPSRIHVVAPAKARTP